MFNSLGVLSQSWGDCPDGNLAYLTFQQIGVVDYHEGRADGDKKGKRNEDTHSEMEVWL